ncbi:MAG: hypothetical protein ACJ72W_13280 [Actinoallomurus sp.]
MTAAHDYEDLHHLIDRMTPDQVRQLRKQALRLVGDNEAISDHSESAKTPAFAGILDGPSDLSERIDEFVEERFNHPL